MTLLRYGREIRWLFQTAMLVFLVTIGLGMARGLHLIEFDDRNQVLTHLHSGTVGWITLGLVATVLWLYGGHDERTDSDRFVTYASILLVVSAPIYIVAWWSANLVFRAGSGTLLLIGIYLFVGWLVWAAARTGYRALTTAQLGAVVGLVALVIGSTLGVALQVQFATGTSVLPGDPIGAHAEAQISAYLMLVSMSLAYAGLHGDDRTRRGTWMVWLLFTAGMVIVIAFLSGQDEASAAFFPFALAATLIFLSITWRRILSPGWLTAGPTRHYAVAIPFGLIFYALFTSILLGFLVFELWESVDDIPANLIPAAEHPLFLGMATNILFAVLIQLNADRRAFFPWADHLLFWGLNGSVAAFFAALMLDVEAPLGIITPILGVSLLVGIVTHSWRLQSPPGAPLPAPEPT